MKMIEEIVKALKDGTFRKKYQKYLRTHDIDVETYDLGDYYVIIDTVNKIAWIEKREKNRLILVKQLKEVKV